jgi:hypothetical protein
MRAPSQSDFRHSTARHRTPSMYRECRKELAAATANGQSDVLVLAGIVVVTEAAGVYQVDTEGQEEVKRQAGTERISTEIVVHIVREFAAATR